MLCLKVSIKGDLVLSEHRHRIAGGGAYDPTYMVDPTGKELGLVAQDANGEEDYIKYACAGSDDP